MYARRTTCCCAFLWAKGLPAKDIHKKVFPVYGEKSLSRKVVHNRVEKFSQGRSNVVEEEQTGRPVKIGTEATMKRVIEVIWVDGTVTVDRVATEIDCFHGLAYTIMHDRLLPSEKCAHGGCPDSWPRSTKTIKWACPWNNSFGMPRREKTCLKRLLLRMNPGFITTNPKLSVLQCSAVNW